MSGFFIGRINSRFIQGKTVQLANVRLALDGEVLAQQKTRYLARAGYLLRSSLNYFSLVSLYSTCLRALGSNFMINIFSGIVFLFLLVV
jgi:hypothetical protein